MVFTVAPCSPSAKVAAVLSAATFAFSGFADEADVRAYLKSRPWFKPVVTSVDEQATVRSMAARDHTLVDLQNGSTYSVGSAPGRICPRKGLSPPV
jgi:hypothetical protein